MLSCYRYPHKFCSMNVQKLKNNNAHSLARAATTTTFYPSDISLSKEQKAHPAVLTKLEKIPAKTGQEKIVNTNLHSEGHRFIVSHCHCVRVESPDCYKRKKKGQRTRQFIADIIACFINSVLLFYKTIQYKTVQHKFQKQWFPYLQFEFTKRQQKNSINGSHF